MAKDKEFKTMFISFDKADSSASAKFKFCGRCARRIKHAEPRSHFADMNQYTKQFTNRTYCKSCSLDLIKEHKSELLLKMNVLDETIECLETDNNK